MIRGCLNSDHSPAQRGDSLLKSSIDSGHNADDRFSADGILINRISAADTVTDGGGAAVLLRQGVGSQAGRCRENPSDTKHSTNVCRSPSTASIENSISLSPEIELSLSESSLGSGVFVSKESKRVKSL